MPNENNMPSVAIQSFLNAMDGVTYLTGLDGNIWAVGVPGWNEFRAKAVAPDLTPASVIERSVFDMINGDDVRDAYRAMHASISEGRRDHITYDYRCDAPDVKRLMRMSLGGIEVDGEIGAALYQSQLITEVARLPMHLFSKELLVSSFRTYDASEIVHVCSYCHDIAWPIGEYAGIVSPEVV
jgi:hypothetical protein